MKVISINLNQGNYIPKQIKIIALSDIHIGDRHSNDKILKSVLERVRQEKDTYLILNGDLCNIALKSSKSDVYEDEMTPMQQVLIVTDTFESVKDKILVIAQGNHEIRIQKETSIDILYLVARELKIVDRYAPSMWYLFLQFGRDIKYNERQIPIMYQITGYHGSGGGRKSGAKINRLEEMAQISVADLYVMSHTHKPIATKGVIYMPDVQHKTIIKKDQYYLMTNSLVEYGGYAESLGLIPSNTSMTEAILDGTKKHISLII